MQLLCAVADVPDNLTKVLLALVTVALAYIAWQAKKIHTSVNSNMQRLSDAIEAEALARGKAEGKATEKADAHERAKPR